MLKNFQTNRIKLITIVSLWFLVSNVGYAQVENTANGSLSIVVTSNGQPVADAHVMIMSWTDPDYKGQGMSDANGALVFTQVPAGTIDAAVVDVAGDILVKASGEVAANASGELVIAF